MESEEKTLLKFYESNGGIGCYETTEGIDNETMLKLCGFMEMVKIRILQTINTAEEDDLN